jgi:hypothetical protein
MVLLLVGRVDIPEIHGPQLGAGAIDPHRSLDLRNLLALGGGLEGDAQAGRVGTRRDLHAVILEEDVRRQHLEPGCVIGDEAAGIGGDVAVLSQRQRRQRTPWLRDEIGADIGRLPQNALAAQVHRALVGDGGGGHPPVAGAQLRGGERRSNLLPHRPGRGRGVFGGHPTGAAADRPDGIERDRHAREYETSRDLAARHQRDALRSQGAKADAKGSDAVFAGTRGQSKLPDLVAQRARRLAREGVDQLHDHAGDRLVARVDHDSTNDLCGAAAGCDAKQSEGEQQCHPAGPATD